MSCAEEILAASAMRPKASQVAFRAQSLFWGSICSNYRGENNDQRRLISRRILCVEGGRLGSVSTELSGNPRHISTRQRAVHVKHHVNLSYQIRGNTGAYFPIPSEPACADQHRPTLYVIYLPKRRIVFASCIKNQ